MQESKMFTAIKSESATGLIKELLDSTQRQLGKTPNLYRTMANSPTTLAGYLAFRDALQKGELPVAMRERVALLTAQLNSCDYCIAAHSFRSQKIGLSEQDIENTRLGKSDDSAVDSALKFVRELVESRGQVADFTMAALTRSGWSEAAIGEIVAHVALNTLSNYFKHVAHPELDFPPAPTLSDSCDLATKLQYAVDAASVEGQWTATSRFNFSDTVSRLKQEIVAHDLLMISEIDPQKILMSAGMRLRPTRQLLFFHPRYMKRLLETDARAVPEVPLKIAVLEAEDQSIILRGPDVVQSFAPYSRLRELARELDAIRSRIVASVAT
jgi:AhpD family alkylhydroperoxidase